MINILIAFTLGVLLGGAGAFIYFTVTKPKV